MGGLTTATGLGLGLSLAWRLALHDMTEGPSLPSLPSVRCQTYLRQKTQHVFPAAVFLESEPVSSTEKNTYFMSLYFSSPTRFSFFSFAVWQLSSTEPGLNVP